MNPQAPQDQGEHRLAPHPATHTIEGVISTLLRTGVTVSILIIIVGTLVTFFHHPEYLHNRAEFEKLKRPIAVPKTLAEVTQRVAEFRGQAIITIGLLVLLITPVLRVAVSIVAFLFERDRAFVAITTAVLFFLLLSFALGRVE